MVKHFIPVECPNRPKSTKNKVDYRFFFHFYERLGKKKFISSGKNNKKFYPQRYGLNPEKAFFRPVLMLIQQKKIILFSNLIFFGKPDM